MRVVKKKTKLFNFDLLIEDKQKYRNSNKIIMHPARVIMCGASGTGKTNTLLNLLVRKETKMDYDHVYLYAKDTSEDKYVWLINYFKKLEKDVLDKTGEVVKLITHSNKIEDVPPLSQIDKTKQNLVIFDDWTNESANNLATLKDYFTMGRKQNCTTFFICHNWYGCPKTFRLNTQYAIILRLPSRREILELYKELGQNWEKDEFIRAYQDATNKNYDCLFIDSKTNDPVLKIRNGVDGTFEWMDYPEPDSE